MGYLTRITGRIHFHPPVPWGEVIGDEYLKRWRHGSEKCLALLLEEETCETDEGTLTRRSAVAIEPITSEPFKAYNIEDELQELVTRYCGPGRMCAGWLYGEGESSGDLWRLRVVGEPGQYRVVKDVPRIVWPDDNEGEG